MHTRERENKVIVENKKVDKKIVYFENHIIWSHDAEEIGVQLVEKSPEKVGHINEEGRDGKS